MNNANSATRECRVPRGRGWEEELKRLFDVCEPARDASWRDYGADFENDTFSLFRYYWGDCICGYEEKEEAWEEAVKHTDACYQVEYRRAAGEFRAAAHLPPAWTGTVEHPEPGVVVMTFQPVTDEKVQEGYRRLREYDEEIRRTLCQKHGLTFPDGSAVHCTCDYKGKWEAFCRENAHDPACPIVKPNFLYKPTGFVLSWYKYPLRDALMSPRVRLREFREMIDACITSVAPHDE